MLSRIALLALGLLFAKQAIADGSQQFQPPMACQYQTVLMHRLALQSAFDVPPEINALMVNVIDGKLPQVRQQLSTMSTADAARWKQSALIIAAYANNSTIVKGLLNDGAAVDGSGWMPDLKQSFHDQAVEEIRKDPNWETNPRPDTGFKEAAVLSFPVKAGLDGTALIIAARCNDIATLDVLLHHHADVDVNPFPNGMNALEVAVSLGNTATVQRLLEHGADVCIEDRLIHQRQLERKMNHFSTIADWGRRRKLPGNVVASLTCPAFDSGHGENRR
ncbi:ankyrin repeat domain-containing protein [Rhodanobacter koreensis]